MDKKIKLKWTEDEKFLFTHTKLRASTVPDKKKTASKKACRRKFGRNDHNG